MNVLKLFHASNSILWDLVLWP